MAETKKKQKCNINIVKVTKNSDEDKRWNNYMIQVVVAPDHEDRGGDGQYAEYYGWTRWRFRTWI